MALTYLAFKDIWRYEINSGLCGHLDNRVPDSGGFTVHIFYEAESLIFIDLINFQMTSELNLPCNQLSPFLPS